MRPSLDEALSEGKAVPLDWTVRIIHAFEKLWM
jgi:hypothetical protein